MLILKNIIVIFCFLWWRLTKKAFDLGALLLVLQNYRNYAHWISLDAIRWFSIHTNSEVIKILRTLSGQEFLSAEEHDRINKVLKEVKILNYLRLLP